MLFDDAIMLQINQLKPSNHTVSCIKSLQKNRDSSQMLCDGSMVKLFMMLLTKQLWSKACLQLGNMHITLHAARCNEPI